MADFNQARLKYRDDSVAYLRQWHLEHPEKAREYQVRAERLHPGRSAANKRRYRAKVSAWYKGVQERWLCEYCGVPQYKSPKGGYFQIETHHRDPETKSFNIGLCDRSIETMRREIAKCDIICRPCHMEVRCA